jgi:hypothetical protein
MGEACQPATFSPSAISLASLLATFARVLAIFTSLLAPFSSLRTAFARSLESLARLSENKIRLSKRKARYSHREACVLRIEPSLLALEPFFFGIVAGALTCEAGCCVGCARSAMGDDLLSRGRPRLCVTAARSSRSKARQSQREHPNARARAKGRLEGRRCPSTTQDGTKWHDRSQRDRDVASGIIDARCSWASGDDPCVRRGGARWDGGPRIEGDDEIALWSGDRARFAPTLRCRPSHAVAHRGQKSPVVDIPETLAATPKRTSRRQTASDGQVKVRTAGRRLQWKHPPRQPERGDLPLELHSEPRHRVPRHDYRVAIDQQMVSAVEPLDGW